MTQFGTRPQLHQVLPTKRDEFGMVCRCQVADEISAELKHGALLMLEKKLSRAEIADRLSLTPRQLDGVLRSKPKPIKMGWY